MNRNSVVRIEVERLPEFKQQMHSKREVLILFARGSKIANTSNDLVPSQNADSLFGNLPLDQQFFR